MLVNLTDVFNSQQKETAQEVEIEASVYDDGAHRWPILEKTPVSFIFTNIGVGRVKITGTAKVVLQTECDRCLRDVETAVELSFDVDVKSPEVPLEEEDDQTYMDGYSLDVEAFIGNEILMSLPDKILCREDCKGICTVCGHDLNLGDCGCDTFVPDPRMAAIKDIFNAYKEV